VVAISKLVSVIGVFGISEPLPPVGGVTVAASSSELPQDSKKIEHKINSDLILIFFM
jgi:hypothetical protein